VLAIALTAAAAVWNWLLLCAFTGGTIPTNAAVTPAALVRAVPKTSLLPSIDSWSIDKAVWVAGIAGLAAVPWIRGRIARRRARALPRAGSSRSIRPDAMAVLALTSASLLVSAGIAAAAIEKPGPYNAHLFEAAFFVPQWQRPARTDRVVAPGEEVWTLIWSFPGFLQPGEYRAVVTGLGGTGPGTRLMVLVDGKTVFDSATNQPTASGPPFRVAQGFHRVDLRAEGGPTHLDAVHIEAAG
jgi:hypothetical protein